MTVLPYFESKGTKNNRNKCRAPIKNQGQIVLIYFKAIPFDTPFLRDAFGISQTTAVFWGRGILNFQPTHPIP